MIRVIIAIIIGVLFGGLLVFVVESLGHMMFPPPDGTDLTDPVELRAIMDTIPIGAKVSVLMAWGLGAFGGGIVSLFLSRPERWSAWAVAGIIFAGAAYTMTQIPHPLWMMIGSVIVTLMGAFGAIKVMGR